MNEYLPNRPEPEDLEKRKILKPSAAAADKKAPPPKKDEKKDDKKDKKKDEKKGGLMGLFGRKKRGMHLESDPRAKEKKNFHPFLVTIYFLYFKILFSSF